jgi:hemerythrin-like domain-containing protein
MAEFRGGTTAEHAFAEHEHFDLAPGIERLHAVARAVGSIAPADWLASVLGVIDWIETILRPHAAWEDAWLYPEIARRAGSPWATKLMTFEHQQILEIAQRLDIDREFLRGTPDRDEMVELRGRLFALEALLRAHIEREERFLLPLLDTTLDGVASGAPQQ